MVQTSGKLRTGGNLLFLNSTANIVRCEMLEAFSFKSATRQTLSPLLFKTALEHKARDMDIKINKINEY